MREMWYRLCVDVDRSGQVLGASYETREDDRVCRIVTMAQNDLGPFDSPLDAFRKVLDIAPLQLRLFD